MRARAATRYAARSAFDAQTLTLRRSRSRSHCRQEGFFAVVASLKLGTTREVEVQRREGLQLLEPRAERRHVRELRAAPEVEVSVPSLQGKESKKTAYIRRSEYVLRKYEKKENQKREKNNRKT